MARTDKPAAKRQRLSSSPPSDCAAPPSSISALGHQFQRALAPSSSLPTGPDSSALPSPTVRQLSITDIRESVSGHVPAESTSREASHGQRGDDDDDIETDVEDEAAGLPACVTGVKVSSSAAETLGDLTNASTPRPMDHDVNMVKADDIAMPDVSQAVKASSSSPVKRVRSKEEIDALRAEALAKRAAKIKMQQEEASQKAQETPYAKELRRMALREERYRLAQAVLGNFGFSVQSEPGMSRFGTGRGGEGVTISLSEVGASDAFGMPIPSLAPEPPKEFQPSETCSDEQRKVLELVKSGGNVFFTGSAGVGKSFLLGEITRLLEHVKRPFQVCATTGIAALAVSGTTLHSWSGVGLGKDELLAFFDKINGQDVRKESKKRNWVKTQTLIIDEISMCSEELFTKLSLLGKLLRENTKAFGGVQLIVCGDFFQLPPVPERHPKCSRCGMESLKSIKPEDSTLPYEPAIPGVKPADIKICSATVAKGQRTPGCGLEVRAHTFCFESQAWHECNFQVMELTKVFRQSDPEFVRCLEKFRRGVCDEESVALLNSCGTALAGLINIKPTNLYPIRASVDNENISEFAKLKADVFEFDSYDVHRGERAKALRKERLRDVPAPEKVRLKKGAQVLLLANLDLAFGLVNGSRGVVVDWIKESEIPEEASHLGKNIVNRGARGFGSEQWREEASTAFQGLQSHDCLPLVYFACGITRLIGPHSWVIDIDRDNAVARTQIPLALAWALTIHKSQGQSLDAVGVRMANVFEKGQAYVALSRCRTPAGMKVEGFRPSHIMAHETVKVFYDKIAKGQSYLDGPPPILNPLDWLPESTVLLDKLARTFGPRSQPLAVGSAVPPAEPVSAFLPPPVVPSETSTNLEPAVFAKLPRCSTEWERHLRAAAAEYAKANPSGSLALFVDQARQLVAIALPLAQPIVPPAAPIVQADSLASIADEGDDTAAAGKKRPKNGRTRRKRRAHSAT